MLNEHMDNEAIQKREGVMMWMIDQQRAARGRSLCTLVIGAVLGLTGCTKEALDPVQTVEWYKTHDPERMAMLQKCHNNPGQLASTPNCVNAQAAESSLVLTGK